MNDFEEQLMNSVTKLRFFVSKPELLPEEYSSFRAIAGSVYRSVHKVNPNLLTTISAGEDSDLETVITPNALVSKFLSNSQEYGKKANYKSLENGEMEVIKEHILVIAKTVVEAIDDDNFVSCEGGMSA